MAKLTLFFLLASLARCVFTLPFLQRNISQLEQHLEIVSGDASTLYNTVTLSSNDLAPVSNLCSLK